MIASPEFMFHTILNYRWPNMKNPQELCNDATYPAPLLPIFAAIIHTKILTDDPMAEIHFESTTNVIAEEFPNLPFSHSSKFLTTVTLILLARDQNICDKYHFTPQRVNSFLKSIIPIFKNQLMKIIQPSLNRSEMLVNRFATASFNFEHLLEDFKDIMKMNRDSFKYGERINTFVMDTFLLHFENALMNKLIENPARFTFGNAMMWNSFLSAFENDERVSMSNLRNLISALIMAQAIAEKPEMKNDICPDLPSTLVAFIIDKYQPDENIRQQLKVKNFLKKYKLKTAPQSIEKFPEPMDPDLSSVAEYLELNNWNKCSRDEKVANVYSFVAMYITDP